jgi:antitoxin HicB
MAEYSYTIVLQSEEDGRFSVIVPALSGCFTEGDSREEAIQNAQEAIALYIEGLVEEGRPIPPDVNPANMIETIRVVA